MDAVMAAAPSDGGGSDADTGWLSDDTGPGRGRGRPKESSGAVSSPVSSGGRRRDRRTRTSPRWSTAFSARASSCSRRTSRQPRRAKTSRSARNRAAARLLARGRFLYARAAPLLRVASTAREKKTHAAPVTGVAFDARGEHVASCAADGGRPRSRGSVQQHVAPRGRSAADPDRRLRRLRRRARLRRPGRRAGPARDGRGAAVVVVGLADGRLVVRTFASELRGRGVRDESDFQSDFGDCTSVRDSAKTIFESRGEGPVRAVAWAGPCVAWANDRGVKIYDIAAQTPVAFIERPRGSPLRTVPAAVMLGRRRDAARGLGRLRLGDRGVSAPRLRGAPRGGAGTVPDGIRRRGHRPSRRGRAGDPGVPGRRARRTRRGAGKETTSTNRRVPPAFRPEMRVAAPPLGGRGGDVAGRAGCGRVRRVPAGGVRARSRERGFGGADRPRSESASPPRLAYLLALKALVAARARTRGESRGSRPGRLRRRARAVRRRRRFGGGDDANDAIL